MSLLENQLNDRPGKRVLVSSQTNALVDKICELVLTHFPPEGDRNLVVRTGDEYRFGVSVKQAALSSLTRKNSEVERIETKIGQALSQREAGAMTEVTFRYKVSMLTEELKKVKRDRTAEEQERIDVLRGASFIFSTLGSAASERLRRCSFDLVVVHGAQAACEARTLLALRHARRYVLFGDKCQLRPMVTDANRWTGYDRSMYERLVDGGYPTIFLNVHSLYHPSIFNQVNRRVYNGRVDNGPGHEVLPIFEWQTRSPVFWPNTVINVPGSEDQVGTSNINREEIAATLAILQIIFNRSAKDPVAVKRGMRIGVLSPYAAQASAIEFAAGRLRTPDHIKIR